MSDSGFSRDRVSDLDLERLSLGELPEERLRALHARLEADPSLRKRLEALREANAEMLRSRPPEEFIRRLQDARRRQDAEAEVRGASAGVSSLQSRNFRLSPFVWIPALTGAAAVAVLMFGGIHTALPGASGIGQGQVAIHAADGKEGSGKSNPAETVAGTNAAKGGSKTGGTEGVGTAEAESQLAMVLPEDDQAEETTRLKGLEPHLAIFRKTEQGAEPLVPGVKARPGELLRIGYQSGGYSFGAILSVDGNGNVTRHWPSSGARSGRLEAAETLLPASFELDSAPRYERFYLLVSRKPFDLGPVEERMRKQLSLPEAGLKAAQGEIRVVRFEVLKENGT